MLESKGATYGLFSVMSTLQGAHAFAYKHVELICRMANLPEVFWKSKCVFSGDKQPVEVFTVVCNVANGVAEKPKGRLGWGSYNRNQRLCFVGCVEEDSIASLPPSLLDCLCRVFGVRGHSDPDQD